MKIRYIIGVAALACAATSANAAVTLTAVDGTVPYSGPAPTYDFDSGPAPITGGQVVTGNSSGNWAQPQGSTGNYWAVGANNGPGFLNLTSFGQIASLSFLWGSIDAFNTLQVIGLDDSVLASWTGNDVVNPANGNQVDLGTNPFVTLAFDGATQSNIKGLRLSSTSNAFETDNFAIQAVPEPGTWLMMLLGFGVLGGAMRAGKRQSAPRVRYAL